MAIDHRLATGRLHVISRGIYAVGRRELTPHGRWMAAVLACGDGAVLSHRSPAQRIAKRDQVHVAAGFRVLRFTHRQVAYAPDEVTAVLRQILRLTQSHSVCGFSLPEPHTEWLGP
jgi:hypothetical protein